MIGCGPSGVHDPAGEVVFVAPFLTVAPMRETGSFAACCSASWRALAGGTLLLKWERWNQSPSALMPVGLDTGVMGWPPAFFDVKAWVRTAPPNALTLSRMTRPNATIQRLIR